MTGPERSPIDVRQFWKTLGERPIGMTLVTARHEERPAGFIALSAAHVSADPPLLLVSIDRSTSALATVLAAGHFAINYLAAGQQPIAELFGRHSDHDQRFASPDWTVLETGAPVLGSGLGAFDCAIERLVELPGTVIAIGRVAAWFAKGTGDPLIFFRGKYL